MSYQASFPGIEAEPLRSDGVFFAIKPDASVASDIHRIAVREEHRHRLRGRPIKAVCLHLTLQSLHDESRVLFAAAQAAAAVAMPPFDVAFDRLESFRAKPGHVPLVLRGDDGLVGVMMLRCNLGEAMEKVGLGPYVQSRFTPHVTLLYGDRPIAEQRIETICWKVQEFVLVRSLHGEGKHIELGRWPLRAST